MTEATYWNGERTNCARGSGVVADTVSPRSPAHSLIGERVRVVRVFYAGESFDLDDRRGQAWWKVTERHGSPSAGHMNLPIVSGTFEPDDWGDLGAEAFKRMGVE